MILSFKIHSSSCMVAVWFPSSHPTLIDLQIDCLRWALRPVPGLCCDDVFVCEIDALLLTTGSTFYFEARKVMLTNMLGRVGKAALQDFILFTAYKWSCFVFHCFNPMDVFMCGMVRENRWEYVERKASKSKSNYILLTDDTNTSNLKSLVLL